MPKGYGMIHSRIYIWISYIVADRDVYDRDVYDRDVYDYV